MYSTISHTQIEKNKFSSYLAGLIEGDGTIIVPKSERSPKGVLNYPSIQIVFHLKDLPLALLIQKNLGHGSLARKKGVNAYILTVNNKLGLLLLLSLINGYMRTPKIYALWKLIDWYNIKDSNLNLEKKPLNTSNLTSDAWLSGFVEADGHFSVRTTKNDKSTRIECKFELSQRQIDHNGKSNLYFLENIAELLSTVVKPVRVDKPNPEYRVRTTNLKGNLNLESYLNNYPLFGSKYLDFKCWIEVVDLFKSGKMDHKLNIEKVIKIKSNMNDKRTIFVWDHLNNFYNLDK
uniref:LAGLIDADG endonuclease n=2 Tax=Orbilia oligospora TaxID=2813651 RepID=A0A481ZL23_ORBOL|nr:LAGLIDADG endonuclease [Orbilia oligospora]QBL02039.1 LAGLIDADG endonuclease [Orbilia oligospora]